MGLVGLCWQGVQANVLAEGGCIIRTADSRVLPFFIAHCKFIQTTGLHKFVQGLPVRSFLASAKAAGDGAALPGAPVPSAVPLYSFVGILTELTGDPFLLKRCEECPNCAGQKDLTGAARHSTTMGPVTNTNVHQTC